MKKFNKKVRSIRPENKESGSSEVTEKEVVDVTKVVTTQEVVTTNDKKDDVTKHRKEGLISFLRRRNCDILPSEGLILKKKEKYYAYEALSSDKSEDVTNNIINIVYTKRELDLRKNKICARVIKAKAQFDPGYKMETIKISKKANRKAEDKAEASPNQKVFIDYIEEGERKSEEVLIKSVENKTALFINSKGDWKYGNNHFFKNPVEIVYQEKVVGTIKANIWRVVGFDLKITKETVEEIVENEIIGVKVNVRLAPPNSPVIPSKEGKPNDKSITIYTTKNDAHFVVPGTLILKYEDNKCFYYLLLNKLPDDAGNLKNTFTLTQLFKVSSKRVDVDTQSVTEKLKNELLNAQEDDEDEEEEE